MLLLSISPSFVHSFIDSVKNISLIQVMYKQNSNFIDIDFLKKYNDDNCYTTTRTNQIFSDMRTFTHTTPEEHTTIFLATTLHTTQLSKKPFCISYKYYLFIYKTFRLTAAKPQEHDEKTEKTCDTG